MELHQLKYLVAVADAGSFTAAAESLHIAQSGVSAQIAKLERELGHRVFERGSRSVRLTAEGELLVAHARTALASVDAMTDAADDLAGLTRGHVRLGTVIGCTLPGYIAGFAEFRADHPNVSVEVAEGNSDDLVAALRSGGIDVGLLAHADPLPDDVASHTLIREPLTAVCAGGHPWARRSSIECADLASQTILCLPPGAGARRALEITCSAERVPLAPAVQTYSPETLLALAARGVGIAVLTAAMARGHSDVTAVPIARSARTNLSLATRRSPSTAARTLASILLHHLR